MLLLLANIVNKLQFSVLSWTTLQSVRDSMYITIKILDCTYIKHVNYKNIQHLMCKKRMHQAAVKYKENMLVLIGYLLHFILNSLFTFYTTKAHVMELL